MDRLLEGVGRPALQYLLLDRKYIPEILQPQDTPIKLFHLFLCHLQASSGLFSHCNLPHVSFSPEPSSIQEFAVPPIPPPAPIPSFPSCPSSFTFAVPAVTQHGPFFNGVSLYQGFILSMAHRFPYQTPTKSPLTETYVCTSITPYLTETIFPLNKLYMAQPLIVKALQHCYLFSECVNISCYTFSVCSFIYSPLCLSFG